MTTPPQPPAGETLTGATGGPTWPPERGNDNPRDEESDDDDNDQDHDFHRP